MSERLLTGREWAKLHDAPVRDRTYRETTLLGPLIAEWLDYKRLQGRADATITTYERDVATFAKGIPGAEAGEVTSADVMAYLTSLKPSQRKRARSALSEFFRWALIWDHVDRNPMDRVPTIEAPAQTVVETFTPEEVDQLCSTGELRDRALTTLLLGSGIRDGEARRVQVKHLRDDGSLFVEGKGRKQRLVPLHPRVAGIVHELVLVEGLEPADHLWYTLRYSPAGMRVRRAKPLGYASFWRWWERTVEAAGVRYRKPHTTRHTYATEYLRRGGRLERLSRILGHSSVEITDGTYAHLDLRDLEEDVLRVWDEPR